MPRVDYESQAEAYRRVRTLSREALERWGAAARPWLRGGLVLDIGSGTGAFSAALADWSGGRVLGVERADAMRSTAPRDQRVSCVGGDAHALPVRDGVASGAWLSTVVHHLRDLAACGGELRRVLRPGSPVLVRGYVPSTGCRVAMLEHFPEAKAVAERFASVDDLRHAWAFEVLHVCVVGQPAPAPAEIARHARRQRWADSTLVALDDAAFERGLASAGRAATAGEASPPDRLALVVLRSSGD